MPLLHACFMEPEVLREHLGASADDALAGTSDTGALADDAARALSNVIAAKAEPGGALEFDDFEGLLTFSTKLLGDDTLASQLLEGGWLDRRGVGAQSFGSLPLRVLQREVTRERLKAAREGVQHGWESELLNLLESAAMRAERAPEEHLILLFNNSLSLRAPTAEVTPALSRAGRVLGSLLRQLRDSGSFDLSLRSGHAPMLHGASGARALGASPLSSDDVNSLIAEAPFPDPRPLTWGHEGLRYTLSNDLDGPSLTVRLMQERVPTLDVLGVSPLVQAPLGKLKRGLILLSGEPGNARTTLFAALLAHFANDGRHVASLEEPLGLRVPGVRQHLFTDAASFARSSRLQPLDVIGFDLLDDAQALDLALDAALDGRLAICVFRAPNVATAVHRASVHDARFHRRRLAEHLVAVSFQRLAHYDGRATLELDFHLPSVALRRHLRAHETPPPPVAFESDNHEG